jgi:hypothetical protein
MLIDGTKPVEGAASHVPGPLSFQENVVALGRAG